MKETDIRLILDCFREMSGSHDIGPIIYIDYDTRRDCCRVL
jgi:hypothetical protein